MSFAHQIVLVAAAPFIGSFLGVVVERLPEGRPVVLARSACDHCGLTLAVRDLVPVISWAAAGGRCRHCSQWLGLFYPAIELAAVLVAVWSVAVLPAEVAWLGAAFGWALLTLSWIDQRTFLLPDMITFPLAAVGLIATYLINPAAVVDHLIGGAAGFAMLVAVAEAYHRLRGREGLGLGDAKLMGAIGTWVSWQGLPTVLLYAAFAGLAWAVAKATVEGQESLNQRLPFGPHLCLASWLVWLYGPLVAG